MRPRGAVSTEPFPVGSPAQREADRLIVRAEELEVVLPDGHGVGPWSAEIRAGEQVLLLGPSGSGKSTLLRTLAGAIPSHQRGWVRGTVQVDGIDPVSGGVLAVAGRVGYLGQDPSAGVCLPRVDEDVALPLENSAVDARCIGPRVEAALAAVHGEQLAERASSTLSGGELQRVALAAAQVSGPSLLLLDEPTAMLDAPAIRAVRSAVETALATTRPAMILVEHRLDEWAGEQGLEGLPGRTIALDRSGHVIADGPTGQVLDEHAEALREAGCWLPQQFEHDHARPSSGPAPEPPASPEDPVLTMRDATLSRGAVPVLENVDLDVHAGRVLAVVGRNGAGKSTLLGALSRLDAPTAGLIEGGAAGLVFQRPSAQFVADTVREELAASGAGDEHVEQMLRTLDLVEQAEQSPHRLSGGQQRRLSVGAMLLTERPVLLADEPGFGLDRAAARTVADLLRAAAREGRAVVLSTHDLHLVQSADEVVVLADGTLHGPMPPSRLLADTVLLRRAGLRDATDPEHRPAADARPGLTPDPRSGHPRRGVLARRNPTVLLGLLTALSAVAILLTDPLPLAVLYLLAAAGTMLGCRIGPLALLRAQVPFALFAAGVLMVNLLSRPGEVLWPDLPVRITREGAVLGTALALRALLIGLGAYAVTRATDPRETMVSLQQHARLPARYAYALLAGRRLLDDLPARWATITRAHRVRLPLHEDGTVPRAGVRTLLRCAFAVLVDAVRSASHLAFALESRGLGEGERTVWRPVALGWGDAVLVISVVACVIAVLLLTA